MSGDELLEATAAFLEEQVRPALKAGGAGGLAFRVRGASHWLGVLARRARDGAALAEAHVERVQELLGRQGTLSDLEAQAARALRAGDLDPDAARAVWLESLCERLAVERPDFDLRPDPEQGT